jgi:Ulp1 family protease
MGSVLKELDVKCNLQEWNSICNSKDDIPQQSNDYDCGIYTCLYTSFLAGLGPMVQKACFPQLRQGMLYSLHRRTLHEIPQPEIIVEKYYAVDYLSNYYIGRALSIENQMVKFK